MTLETNAAGEAGWWSMTRKEFFKLSTERRNTPGRTGSPTCLALCPKTGATVLVPVIFTCAHGTLEKVLCAECTR